MRIGRSAAISDPADLQFRTATVQTGSWLSLVIGTAAVGYYAATWHAGNRTALAATTAGAIVWGVAVRFLPVERIVASRWRETFFMGWSAGAIAVIAALVALDTQPRTPLALGFFIPLLFAGMSYPRRNAAIVAAMIVAAYAAVSLATGEDVAYSALLSVSLVCTSALALAQTRHRERQREEIDRHREELSRISRVDPLTDALNRRGFEERFTAELADAARTGAPLVLVVLDVDDFKAINDAGGHLAGDDLLRGLVTRLGSELRPMDALGRIGGDEFAVVLPGVPAAEAPQVAERIRAALEELVPVCIGYSAFPSDGVTEDELYRNADQALYLGKAARPARSAEPLALSDAAALADAVDQRMDLVHAHSRMVAEYASLIAEQLGHPDEEIGLLRLAATLHDVGKVTLSDALLRKPGPLSDEEAEEMRRHALVGADLVSRIPGMDAVATWVRHAHEHVDGSGYPDGLAGDEIPLAARILLVADAFDAMTADRPYRRGLPPETACDELRRHAGTQFDPACVEALLTSLGAPARD